MPVKPLRRARRLRLAHCPFFVWFGLVVLLPLGFIGGGEPPQISPTGVGKQHSYPRLHPLLLWGNNSFSPCPGLSDMEAHTAIGGDVGLSAVLATNSRKARFKEPRIA